MDEDYEDYHRRRRRLLLLFYYLLLAKKNNNNNRFRYSLSKTARQRRVRKIPRISLLNPESSPWEKLYSSADDGALITVTGFDHEAFKMLLGLFQPLFDNFSPWTGKCDGSTYKKVTPDTAKGRGKARIITATSCLGLCLAWYRFRGSEFVLQGWFGFTGSHCNVWLRFARRMLLKCLCQHPLSRVRFPSDEAIEKYQQIVLCRHPSLCDVYCTADGCKLKLQSCKGLSEQGMYYNGWLHGHYVTNLFVFGADGRIIAAALNAPGSIHDSTLAYWSGIYTRLEETYNRTKGICCVDSAFASNPNPYLLRSAQDTAKAKDPEEYARLIEATSLRQASEWGMRALQSAFPRLKDELRFEQTGERGRILKLVPLLYNFRLEAVGLNQIRNTYVPAWNKEWKDVIET
jgi:hypothetical protein